MNEKTSNSNVNQDVPEYAELGDDGKPSSQTDPSQGRQSAASAFLGRTFDDALAWGLLFLLPAETQRSVIQRVARAIQKGRRFLFTYEAVKP